ncbi:MAG TPA: TonB-dependent receptor [Xanthobacteraceae bacterium]|nr:TonB-dependent receptor [Xanthobacteraceae bacterium]
MRLSKSRAVILAATLALVVALAVCGPRRSAAQNASPPPPNAAASTATHAVPEIVVTAPKPKVAGKPRRKSTAPPSIAAAPVTQTPGSETGGAAGDNGPPLQQAPALDKTGTALANLPQSVVVVPRAVIVQQAGVSLADAIKDVSGVNQGGSSSYGFFDRFTIRGMDARIYSDGFPDGDQFNGFPHSINGVQSIEVLKGPGSALFGSGPPGGTINIVHFLPSPVPGYGLSSQLDSWGTWVNTIYATGPTGISGLNYRIDGLFQDGQKGFRGLNNSNYELRPEWTWTKDNHVLTFALDFRRIERTPDGYGIVYVNGPPLGTVPSNTKYSTPFGFGNQDFARGTLTDAWWIADFLTVNNRFGYTYRDVSILRNSGGTVAGAMLTKRQLREQTDLDNDFVYQFEPVWKFHTGSIFHTLLTGAQVEWQSIDDDRATADLPNIANIYAPVIPETSTASLTFLRDAAHSGMVDDLRALYLSAYTTDQIDMTEQWKVRLGVRKDYWDEMLTPQAFVPGRIGPNGMPLEPGMTDTEIDTPTSWSVGTLYKLFPGVAPFAGVSKSYLTNFNSESTQNGVFAPESGLEYEAGLKLSTPDGRFTLTGAAFEIFRNNVFTENTTTNTIAFNAQKSYGFDADLQWQITPQWKVLANMISQTAKLTAVPLTPVQVGNWPVGVPAHIYNVWSTYDFAIAGIPGFTFGAGVSYNGLTFGSTANTVWVPSSAVVDTMLRYSAAHWDAQIGVKNVTNIEYFTTAESAGGYVGEPRTYYGKVDWHY